MRINRLRAMAVSYTLGSLPQDTVAQTQQAFELLNDIINFSVDEWAESRGTTKEDNMLLGQSYKSGIYIYCILSLQSVGVLPSNEGKLNPLTQAASHEAQFLCDLMVKGFSNKKIILLLLWPLTVLGAQAVHEGESRRDFVRKWADEIYAYTASYSVWHLKEVLEKFWASGKTRWDDCFDRPYLFSPATNMDSSTLVSK